MMMKNLIFLLAGLSVTYAQIPQAQYKQGCELLGKKIFCFGGAVRDLTSMNPNYADSFYNKHYVLDLSNFTNTKDAGNLKWQEVPPPTNQFDLEARADFGHVKVSDNSYIVFGGAGGGKTYASGSNLHNLTTIYFADQNSWQTISASQSLPRSVLSTQTFGSQAVMDGNGTVWLLGGIPPNPQAASLTSNNTILKVEKQNAQWTDLKASPMSESDNYNTRFNPTVHHAAVAMADSYLYSFGGLVSKYAFIGDKNNYDDISGDFKLDSYDYAMYEYLTYNKSGNNSLDYRSGFTFPRQRELHTMTALPNSNTFYLYGGINGNSVLNDYCYSYDTTTSRWSKVIFQSGGPGPRFGHSAIAYGSDALFVMFGADVNGKMLNDAYVLNITTYEWTAIPATNNGTSSDQESSGSGIGTGVIVGIVIGALAVVAIIAGGGYFLYKRGVFNSAEPATTFTAPVYGQDGFGDDFARPTDEKFGHSGNQDPAAVMPLHNMNGSARQLNTHEPVRVKPTEYEDYSSHTATEYGGTPMKPMADHNTDARYSSPSTATYVDDPSKPYGGRESEEIRSTSGLVKPSDPYSDNQAVKPHGMD